MFHPNDNSALFHLFSSHVGGIKAYKCDGRDLMEENVISAYARSSIDEREKQPSFSTCHKNLFQFNWERRKLRQGFDNLLT